MLCWQSTAQAAPRRVPFGFFGVTTDITSIRLNRQALLRERNLMVRSGVESVRLLISWRTVQPYESFDEVPASQRSRYLNLDGVPTDLRRVDEAISLHAARGQRVMPVVAFSPTWASGTVFQPGAPPRDARTYGRFLDSLVRRYGPRGTFWRSHRAPFAARIRYWQLWNEPDLPFMWSNNARNFAPGYVELLRHGRAAIKAVDPGARIVLAGLTSSVAWPRVWDAFAAVYRAGGRGLFDIAAVHPFTRTPQGVLAIVQRVRDVMNRHGDRRTPLMVTEFSWSSRRGNRRARRLTSWEVTSAQQRRNLSTAYNLFAGHQRRLRLVGAFWFSWMSNYHDRFWSYWTGLRRRVPTGGTSQPVLTSYQRSARIYEGCAKSGFATRCRPPPPRRPAAG